MASCHCFFNHGLKFQNFVCHGCHHLRMLCLNMINIAIDINTIKWVDSHCIIHDKSETIHFLGNNWISYVYIKCIPKKSILKSSVQLYFDNLVKAKKIKTKSILVDEKNYKDLVIYFTTSIHRMPMKMSNIHFHELIGKIEQHEEKEYFVGWWLYAW